MAESSWRRNANTLRAASPIRERPVASKTAYRLVQWGIPLLTGVYFLTGISPLIIGGTGVFSTQSIHSLYSHFCHQVAERSFACGGIPFASCSRCTGFYGGLFLGTLVVSIGGGKKQIGIVAAVILVLPALADFWLDFGGETEIGNLVRAMTGLLAASGVVFYVFPRMLRAAAR